MSTINKKKSYERYKNVRIDESPLSKYPEMVTITKTPAKLKELLGKKYINVVKCKESIDILQSETLIDNGRLKSQKELLALGMGNEVNF